MVRITGAVLGLAMLDLVSPIRCVAQAGAGEAPVRFREQPAPYVSTLLLHQISDRPIVSAHGEDNTTQPWASPAQFDRLLTDAERRGYHVVSLAAALDVLDGHAPPSSLPAKPLLLTFDDGYTSAWLYGTPILRKHHAVAAMFFEGLQTDTNPDRLTRTQLRAMAASGVWTLESHGFAGHSNITLDAAGNQNPYWYANTAWLPAKHRRETFAEFETRIRSDLRRFRTTFEPLAGHRIDVLAYPSGEFGQNPPPVPGAGASDNGDAGHSNVSGLTPYLFDALRKEGFRAAFAVSLAGIDRPASASDDPLAYPRLGVGATFNIAELDALQSPGIDLPAVATDGQYADCGPVAVTNDRIWIASTNRPELFGISYDGRVIEHIRVDALMDDRAGQAALISGLIVHGSEFTVVQQSGTWPGATARLTRLRIAGGDVRVLERRALPEALNWLVGIAQVDGALFGLDDAGELFELAKGTAVYTVPLPAGADRQDRFVGPVTVGNRLSAYDTKAKAFVTLGPDDPRTIPFAVDGATPHDFTTSGDSLFVTAWNADHHALARYHVEGNLRTAALQVPAAAATPAADAAGPPPQPGSLGMWAVHDPRFADTSGAIDAYRPFGRAVTSPLRPYAAYYENYDSTSAGGARQFDSGNYVVGAVGLQYVDARGLRIFAQFGAALPTRPLQPRYARDDMRGGVTFSRGWPSDDDGTWPLYLSFFSSAAYLSRYTNAYTYTEIEGDRRFGSPRWRFEGFLRNTLTLDARDILANNVAETSLGLRAFPFGRSGPSVALEAVAGTYVRGRPHRDDTFPPHYLLVRPALALNASW